MYYLSVCSQGIPASPVVTKVYKLSSWYCKPAILRSIAYYFNRVYGNCLFVTCEKYGCQQFTPQLSKSYPISKIFSDGACSDLIIPAFDNRILESDVNN